MRVYLDGKIILDNWIETPPTLKSTNVSISAGQHNVKVEIYSKSGTPYAYTWWTKQ